MSAAEASAVRAAIEREGTIIPDAELMAAPVWISKYGPFAWNGLMTFWFAMVLYVSWQIIVYVCIFRSIRNQPAHEPAPR